jgi:hypothetical protein
VRRAWLRAVSAFGEAHRQQRPMNGLAFQKTLAPKSAISSSDRPLLQIAGAAGSRADIQAISGAMSPRADSGHSLRSNRRAFLRQKAAVRWTSLYRSCWTDLRFAHRRGHAEEDRDTLTAAAGRTLFRFEAKAAVDVLPAAAAANMWMACKPTSAKARRDFAVRRRVTYVTQYPTPEILL